MGNRRGRSPPRREFPLLMIAFGVGLIAAMVFSPRFALLLAAVMLIYCGLTSRK
ncbi:MAG: hypothetical protein FWE32_05000 [Oscillospiraceae bacterium]|nr:hypothetical protein [Oscillospiraceae bacterium]